MNVLDIIQILLSIGTFVVVLYQSFKNNKDKKADRKIRIKLDNQREKQRKLFEHIVEILHVDSMFVFADVKAGNASPFKLESIMHNLGIITNINQENKYANKLRNECLELTFWFSGLRMKENESCYTEESNKAIANISVLIEDYIKEEDRLIENLEKL